MFLRFPSFKCIFFHFKHSNCVPGSERCQYTGDLHLLLCLNASSVDTEGGLKLLLCCLFYTACVDTVSHWMFTVTFQCIRLTWLCSDNQLRCLSWAQTHHLSKKFTFCSVSFWLKPKYAHMTNMTCCSAPAPSCFYPNICLFCPSDLQ